MEDEHPKYVCHECIGDEFLASEVKAQCDPLVCHYCGETREAITLENLADRTHGALQKHFRLTPDYPSEPDEYMQARERRWERRGDPVEYIIAETAGLDERVARDVTAFLSDRHGHWAIREGNEDPYGADAMYEPLSPNDSHFEFTWEVLCDELKSNPTLFSAKLEEIRECILDDEGHFILRIGEDSHQHHEFCEDMLAFIFGDLNSHVTGDDKPVVREISPGEEDALVWRARAALSEEELKAIVELPSRTLSSPPPTLAKAGRMNVEGSPVFYGAMDQQTCVSEVRAPVGAHVVVGRFNLLRPVRLLDLDALSNVYARGSCFDPDYSEQEGRAAFLRQLVREISRPVMPKDEALDYLPTQAVAEYLSTKVNPRVDGVIFLSSQTGGDGRNVVLFNHARRVEPSNLPEWTNVEVLLPSSMLLDPYEEPGSDIVVFETVPSNSPSEESATSEDTGKRGVHGMFSGDEPEDEGEPTLRLDPKSLKVLTIKAVTYTAADRYVSWIRQTEEERNAFSQQFVDPDVDDILNAGL